VPDLVTVPNTLRIHDGKTGAVLAENSTFLAYATPTDDESRAKVCGVEHSTDRGDPT
jgi:hypothetical protein